MLVAADEGALVVEAVGTELSKAGTGGSCTRNSGVLDLMLPFTGSSWVRGVSESTNGKDGASAIGVSVECSMIGIGGLFPASVAIGALGNVCSVVGESRSILINAETTDVGEATTLLRRRSNSLARSRCRFPSNFFASETTLFFGFGV